MDNFSADVTIINSTISGNFVGNSGGQFGTGGGINTGGGKLPGNLTVINSTISGNFASLGGGGIASGFSGLTIVNSTISGNSIGDPDYGNGGGIGASSVTLVNSTVSGNSAATCGGVCGGTVEIGNTILNANASGNIDGTVTSHGYNISSDDGGGHLNGPGDQINTDPLLGPLQDNGGPTLTHLPMPGSPAIDAGDPNFTRRRLLTISAAVVSIACSVVASISVQSRHNRGPGARLQHHARFRTKVNSNQ